MECIFAVSFHGNLPEILKNFNTDHLPFQHLKVDVFRIFLNCHILNLWGGEGGSRIMYVPTNTMQLIEGGGGDQMLCEEKCINTIINDTRYSRKQNC